VSYWSRGEPVTAWTSYDPTAVDGIVRREELVERYAAGSGRDLAELDFYAAFVFWRIACIYERVYARHRSGAQGDDTADREMFGARAVAAAHEAEEWANRFVDAR
jgi:aminoglycoside phosphotransferase (APT) family kinase protein